MTLRLTSAYPLCDEDPKVKMIKAIQLPSKDKIWKYPRCGAEKPRDR
jgi:hypothetical protein